MSDAYRIAPLFCIRMAGAPFEAVKRLGTPESIELARTDAAEPRRSAALALELSAARIYLYRDSARLLPRLLLFGSAAVRQLLTYINGAAQSAMLPARNARAGDRERHMLLYLQRVCAKNDTFSEFGPTAWGTIGESETAVRFAPQPITRRDAYLERWVAHVIAAAIAADPDAPEKGDVPALDPYAAANVVDQIRLWSDAPARERWLEALDPLAQLPAKFITMGDTAARLQIMNEAQERLRQLGAARAATQRHLYAATNPIGEECAREGNFVISQRMADDLTREAEPWIDLWRDSYAFVASRVAAGLRRLFSGAPVRDGAIALPDFLAHCTAQRLPLTGEGIVRLAHLGFQEVKAAFLAEIENRSNTAELQLTTDECHVVRRNFEYAKFNEYTYPSADLQISAESSEAVAAGNYEWILSELHPAIALLHHCFWWSCPDHSALSKALRSTVCGVPSLHYGFFAADFTAHTTVRVFDALPDVTNFVAPQLAKPEWRSVPPTQAEVFIDESSGDVGVRVRGSREYLGSFARSWVIPLGFHPFSFGGLPHTPRLRCGKVIVQRRSWVVKVEEFGSGNFTGVSADLLRAVERLRAARDLPRYVYIRPSEAALRRSGAEGRDKDTKPVFIDLESYLFVEIFHRWLTKAGELELTEMLPDPDHLLWREEDGCRTFELRTLIVPRR